jgi:cytidylate kinase
MNPALIPHEKYVVRLGRVVLAAARCGKVILVGRGARFLLPPKGLAVRIIAPLAYRVHHIMEQKGVTAAAARTWVENADRERHDFVRRYFRRDVADPHLYDVVINVEPIGRQCAVQTIVTALGCEGRCGERH